MRIPHHLHKAPSGVWHYRQRIPPALIALIGRAVVKKSMTARELHVGQSTKNEVSNRVFPVHPQLIRMGLLKRIERLRKIGETRLFPKVDKVVVNGSGDWLSKAFGRHVKRVLPAPDVGKLGFHSFRKTVIQTM